MTKHELWACICDCRRHCMVSMAEVPDNIAQENDMHWGRCWLNGERVSWAFQEVQE